MNMKKQLGILLGIVALLPIAGMANIVVTAAAQDTGFAYIYDSDISSPTYQTIFSQADFVNGFASIPTATIPTAQYGIAMSYDDSGKWISNIAPAGDADKVYNPGAVDTATAVTGSVTDRSFTSTTTSLTLNSNGSQHIYNAPAFTGPEIGATMGLYRPALVSADADVTKSWNSGNIELGFDYDVTAVDAYYDIITLHNMTTGAADFTAQYLAHEVSAGSGIYNLFFEELAYGLAAYDEITGSGDDLVLTLASGAVATDDATPYYVIMDQAYMYDSVAFDADYSAMLDGGLSLTNPEHYVIPEPATLMLIMGAGSGLLVIRRIFTI